MVTHETKLAACGGADGHQVHIVLVCCVPTQRLLPDASRGWKYQSELAYCSETTFSLRKTERVDVARQ